jgi:hypothetical protein
MIRFWHKFNQVVKSNICKEVDTMCNLSQGIVDRVTAEVTAKNLIDFIMKIHQKGYTLEQISEIAEKSVPEIEEIIDKNSVLV